MNLYQDNILDHYHNPRHFGLLENPTHQAEALNPTCGDRLTVSLKVEDATVRSVGFEGEGCAISIASASILYETLVGMETISLLQKEPSEVLQLIGLTISPGRMKCALLSLEALKKALHGKIEI
jgi:nitrogen fixation protein NifU and related proteins